MLDWTIYFQSLGTLLIFGLLGWFVSLVRGKVSHVDSMWSLFFLLASLVYAGFALPIVARAQVVLVLVFVWSLRLSVFITWRNKGHEDHRYETIRQNNEPNFKFKSLYIVFAFQAVLAWVIAIVLWPAITLETPPTMLDYVAIVLTVLGLCWEVMADWQLTNFKAQPSNQGKVLDTGLWRYSRHPNYFGECCVWWGFYLFALSAGAWWTIVSPLLMTLLLLKVSGVSLLESTIVERRPAYAVYIKRTSAFIPRRPKA